MVDYRSGACNIGRAERRKRYVLGISALAAALVGVWRTGIATPLEAAGVLALLFMGFEGVYQGKTGFCAAFGHIGIYDVSDSGKAPDQVRDPADRRTDWRRAMQVHALSAGAALAVMAVLLVLTH